MDELDQPHPPEDTPAVCWAMAYSLFPELVESGRLVRDLERRRLTSTPYYYVLACTARGHGPREELLRAFRVHTGRMGPRHRWWAIEFPAPPPPGEVLAPWFSAVVEETSSGARSYFVLGQSPDGGTTLRRVTTGTNANLGPGGPADLQSFLSLIRKRWTRVTSEEERESESESEHG